MPTLTVTTRTPADIAADSVVVASIEGKDGALLAPGHGLPSTAAVHLEAMLADLDAKGSAGEVGRFASVPGVKATSVTVTGLGKEVTGEALRAAAADAVRALRSKKHVVLALPTADLTALAAAADGAAGGGYCFAKIGAKADTTAVQKITVVSTLGAGKGVKDAVARAEVIGRARDWTRDLVNTPPNVLYPASFEAAAKDRAKASPAKVTVTSLDEKALAKGGFGGIVGVGQGSANPPRIVTMSWKPAKAKASIALVGKGITFDSGGLCLKTPAGMLAMKTDMAGAAAVACAVLAIAHLRLPIEVTGYLALAENMPGASAQRPGDVVAIRGGRTVEIVDTDAEGRMVLADALALASESTPEAIVDIATLTGAQITALGPRIGAVLANDEQLQAEAVAAGHSCGERLWPLPIPDDSAATLRSAVADLRHKGPTDGGMLYAAGFLREFVGTAATGSPIPWAHLDIAGPALNRDDAYGYVPKGGTGYGVRTLVALAERFAAR